MNPYDPEMAARVWQRVQGKNPPAAPAEADIRELIAQQWLDAAICSRLSRQFRGTDRALLRRIARSKQENADCVKGICTLMTGSCPSVPRPPIPQGTPISLLQDCCSRTIRCASRCEALSSDPNHGPEFSRLAARERAHNHLLLSILGRYKTRK